MDIGQVVVILVAHPDVEYRKTLFIRHRFELAVNDGVFTRLAVFHHQCNFHSVFS
ncbi:hypothetical protein SDC9_202808 [bioreactor metagenome]|uniref:Uncharacterized protein n=1 Tax=bioreactor metagenome TaxID=1076179 RepID=A0A645IXG3_9ZZZZ